MKLKSNRNWIQLNEIKSNRNLIQSNENIEISKILFCQSRLLMPHSHRTGVGTTIEAQRRQESNNHLTIFEQSWLFWDKSRMHLQQEERGNTNQVGDLLFQWKFSACPNWPYCCWTGCQGQGHFKVVPFLLQILQKKEAQEGNLGCGIINCGINWGVA